LNWTIVERRKNRYFGETIDFSFFSLLTSSLGETI
jgi:hypothetical protein